MSYLPRPEASRTEQDIDELYIIASEELQAAKDAAERRKVFRNVLVRAYGAGADAQREIVNTYVFDRPTPVPPPPVMPEDDPGTLPPGPHPRQGVTPHAFPAGVMHPNEPQPRPRPPPIPKKPDLR